MAYQGLNHPDTTVSFFLHEYITRKRMQKLGLVTDLGKIPAIKVEAFLVIDDEIDQCDKRKAKRKR